MKQIRITKHVACHGGFYFKPGDELTVKREGKSDEKSQKVFLVDSKVVKGGLVLPIVIYENECEIIN